MAYGSAMSPVAGYSAVAFQYNASPGYCPPGFFQPFSYASSPAQAVQTSAQMLQAFVSLQANWSQFLGANPQLQATATSYDATYASYASYYQAYLASRPAPSYQTPAYQAPAYQAPAYEAPAPAVQVAAAVNVEAPPAPVEVATSSGGDGGGDGGDPVILDLNGDNKLDTTGANGAKINFNLFGNGTNVKTEWLKAGTEDGLLVSDFNGDGKIDSGRELMRTTGVNGEQGKYKGGWDKLSKLFDQNKDGTVSGDELDQLKVWVDKDGDGVSDEGELRSVKELGISKIDIPGQGVKSNFTMNGRQQMAEDYVFDLAQ